MQWSACLRGCYKELWALFAWLGFTVNFHNWFHYLFYQNLILQCFVRYHIHSKPEIIPHLDLWKQFLYFTNTDILSVLTTLFACQTKNNASVLECFDFYPSDLWALYFGSSCVFICPFENPKSSPEQICTPQACESASLVYLYWERVVDLVFVCFYYFLQISRWLLHSCIILKFIVYLIAFLFFMIMSVLPIRGS